MPPTKDQVPEMDVDAAKKTAEAISRIDTAMKTMLAGGLKKKTLVILLAASTGVGKREIERVLDGLSTLSKDFLERK